MQRGEWWGVLEVTGASMKGGGATDEEWYAGLLLLVLVLLSLEVFAVHLLLVLEGIAKCVAVCY